MLSDDIVSVVGDHTFIFKIFHCCLYLSKCLIYSFLSFVHRQFVEQGVIIECLGSGHPDSSYGIGFGYTVCTIKGELSILIIRPSDTVVFVIQGGYVLANLCQALSSSIIGKRCGVRQIEVSVKVIHDLFRDKRLSSVRY